MALPTSLGTGTLMQYSNTLPGVRPIMDSNGNIYIIHADTGISPHGLVCLKSTNAGVSFSEVDAANAPQVTSGPIRGLHYDDHNGVIHVITADTQSAIDTENYERFTFHMSDAASNQDTWQIANELIATGGDVITASLVRIAIRSTGDIVVAYPVNDEKVHGADYNRWAVNENTGSGWSQGSFPIIVGTGQQVDFGFNGITVDSSDRVWFTEFSTNGTRSLYLADGSSSLSAYSTVSTDASGGGSTVQDVLVHHLHGATSRKTYVFEGVATGRPRAVEHDGTGAPAAAQDIDTDTVFNYLAAVTDDENDTVYVLKLDSVSDDMAIYEDSGTGWSSETVVRSISPNNLTGLTRANIYTHNSGNGGARVLGYCYYDSTALLWYYDEVVLVPGTLIVTPAAATFGLDTLQGAHSTPLIVTPAAATFKAATNQGTHSTPFEYTPTAASFATATAGGTFASDLIITPAQAIFATSVNQGAHITPLIVTPAPATFSTATAQGTHSTPFEFTPGASTFATAVNQGTHNTPFEFTPSAGAFATATQVGQVIAPFTPSAATFALTVNQGTHSFPVDLTPAPATFSAATAQGTHSTPFEFTPSAASFATASAGGDFITELVVTPAPATFGTAVNQGTHDTPFVFTPASAAVVMASAGGQFYSPVDITPSAASFALAVNQGAHITPLIVAPTISSFATTTIVGSIETGSTFTPPAATFGLDTLQGIHSTPLVLTPSPATFATSVANGEIVAPVVVVPGAATFSLASVDPIVETGFVFTPAAATFTAAVAQGLHFTPLEISANAVTASFGVSQGTHYVPYDFTPSPAQMSMSAQQGTHYTPFTFTPAIAEFGADAVLGLVISDLIVTPSPATFALASIDPIVFASVLIQPAPATFAMSTLFSETEFTPDPATFALVSQVGAIINPIEPVLYLKRDLIRVHDVQLNGVSVLAYNVLEALTGDEWGEGYVVLAENYDDGSPDTEFDRKVGADLSDGQQVNKTYRGAVTVFV